MPDELVDKVYLPEKKGSLQIEMIATTREYGRLPYLIEPDLEHLIEQLQSGHPVLVLQNLGWRVKPIWHYAVVIGYEPESEHVLLRSGINANKRLSLKKFLRSWERAEFWGFVALIPGEIPENVNFQRYMQTLSDMQQNTDSIQMIELFKSASQHFPRQALSWMALANAYHHQGYYKQAAKSFNRVLLLDPNHTAARNNLALSLSAMACHEQALQQANRAVRLAASSGEFELESGDTLASVKANSKADNNKVGQCQLDAKLPGLN